MKIVPIILGFLLLKARIWDIETLETALDSLEPLLSRQGGFEFKRTSVTKSSSAGIFSKVAREIRGILTFHSRKHKGKFGSLRCDKYLRISGHLKKSIILSRKFVKLESVLNMFKVTK